MQTYTLKDIHTLVSLKPRTVIHWGQVHVVVPEVRDIGGTGNKRTYSRRNVLEFFLAKKLVEMGMSLSGIRRLITTLRDCKKLEGQVSIEDAFVNLTFDFGVIERSLVRTDESMNA